ncbi:MAG: CobD/CbiB family protein [Limnohabitans sp.]|jgi:adenosylcobinamide-phosphate synthase|uniref:CobD/CbiB family protein n=1 Tax=Limnohabitans sp. TaxID=1907725 RepID=UPI0025DD824B|nr:CobD/CbiB family protein [Limnohabitans sp.]MCO4088924.1 CobD/CbiB family protein [Limnohabitans sp.]
MSFFAILLALILEQVRPLKTDHLVFSYTERWVIWTARTLDAGARSQAWITWGVTILGPALLVMLVHWLLAWGLGWWMAFLWNVALLYATLGFRQFSHHFTGIREALDNGDENKARELLAQWQQVEVGQIPRSEIVRHVIEYSVIAAHRHVFGVFFWYVILSIIGLGPVGAVIYRLTEFAQRRWQRAAADGASASDVLGAVSLRAWQFMDRLPSRMTALGFAIVGSFEDAMDGWRHHAQNFPQDNDGVILAATAGAINIRLGGAALTSSEEEDDETLSGSSSTPGRIASQSHFAQVVGLVWRTMIMWLLLLALLTMANLIG